ncbi:hypothetical protein BAGA_06735, partial [Bacillus gaemokensis]
MGRAVGQVAIDGGQQAASAHHAEGLDQRRPLGRGAIEHFLARFLALHQAQRGELLQRIADDMGIFEIEGEADVGQLLAALAVVHVVQHQDVVEAQVRLAGRGHAARHPAAEGVVGDDEA